MESPEIPIKNENDESEPADPLVWYGFKNGRESGVTHSHVRAIDSCFGTKAPGTQLKSFASRGEAARWVANKEREDHSSNAQFHCRVGKNSSANQNGAESITPLEERRTFDRHRQPTNESGLVFALRPPSSLNATGLEGFFDSVEEANDHIAYMKRTMRLIGPGSQGEYRIWYKRLGDYWYTDAQHGDHALETLKTRIKKVPVQGGCEVVFMKPEEAGNLAAFDWHTEM